MLHFRGYHYDHSLHVALVYSGSLILGKPQKSTLILSAETESQ